MKETRIEIRKKCEDGVVNIVDNDNNPIGSQTVESGGIETYAVTDLPCAPDTDKWVLKYKDQTEEVIIDVDSGMIATFASGSGVNIGTLEISTDGINYAPVSYPFTPSVGTYYFKRSTALITATYTMIQ